MSGKAVVKLDGIIVNVGMSPEEKNPPFQMIDILQTFEGGGSNLETVKDFDLKAIHTIGDRVSLPCQANVYSFNGRAGVSYKIFRGQYKNLNVSDKGTHQPTTTKEK